MPTEHSRPALAKSIPDVPTSVKLQQLANREPGWYELRRVDSDIADFDEVAVEAMRLAVIARATKLDFSYDLGLLIIELPLR